MTPLQPEGPTEEALRVAGMKALVANVAAMKRAALNEDWDHLTNELLPVVEMLAAQQLAIAVACEIAKSG